MGQSGHVSSSYAHPCSLSGTPMVPKIINDVVWFCQFFFGVCLVVFFLIETDVPFIFFFLPWKSIVLSILFLSLLSEPSISAPPGLGSSSESSAIFSFASCSPVREKHFYPAMGNFPTRSFSSLYMLFCYYYLYKLIFTCHCLPLI